MTPAGATPHGETACDKPLRHVPAEVRQTRNVAHASWHAREAPGDGPRVEDGYTTSPRACRRTAQDARTAHKRSLSRQRTRLPHAQQRKRVDDHLLKNPSSRRPYRPIAPKADGTSGFGAPKGTRTPVFAVRGRRPGPLDDGSSLRRTAVYPASGRLSRAFHVYLCKVSPKATSGCLQPPRQAPLPPCSPKIFRQSRAGSRTTRRGLVGTGFSARSSGVSSNRGDRAKSGQAQG